MYELNLYENYDPSKTDDGQSPLQTHDWGLTVGILRPGNGTETVKNYDFNYDGFGNAKWLIESDDYAVTSDTMDVLGRFLGTNPATSFSLKPRAYKPFRYKGSGSSLLISTDPKEWETDSSWLIPCVDDERNIQGEVTRRIRSRGTVDTFLAEYMRFLLHRQKYKVRASCQIAELADIPNHWLQRYEIDSRIGWIDKVNYSVDVEKGIGVVEVDFYSM